MKLNDIAEFVTDKVSSSSISLENYVTTDSLLQNKRGRETAQNLPPVQCALTHYKQGDVLVANIRPYLKKVWFADSEGGCSSYVLVFRAKIGHYPSFLYTVLIPLLCRMFSLITPCLEQKEAKCHVETKTKS